MNVRLMMLSSLFAAGCGGVVDAPASDGQDFNGGSIGVFVAGPLVTIDSVTPAVPVEGRRVVVRFTLDNFDVVARTGRVGATVSPVASAPVDAAWSWRVDQLAPRGRLHGTVAFDAPPASRSNDVALWFEDSSTKVRNTATHQTFDVAGRYTFEVADVTVDNPRSHNTDTDYVGFAALDPRNNLAFARSAKMGNGGAGHDFYSPYRGDDAVDAVPDLDSITLGTLVVNQGQSDPKPGSLESIAAQLVQGTLHEVDLTQTGWWDAVMPWWPLFDCDGVVVADRRVVTGRQLADGKLVAGDQKIRAVWSSRFPVHGYNSPPGCGAVSNYQVTLFAISRTVAYDKDVVVNPAVTSVRQGGHVQFTTRIAEAVDWTVDGGAINGYIDANGLYTLPAGFPVNNLIQVRATARDGSGRTGVAQLSVNPTRLSIIGIGVLH